MKLEVIIHDDPNGGYWAEVPALPGCFTQGETMTEIRANIREAVTACLEVSQDRARRERGRKSNAKVLEMAL